MWMSIRHLFINQKPVFIMKKAAFSILACLFTLCFANADAQSHYSSNHPHHHLTTGVASIIYDPFGTGEIQEEVYLSLGSHPECTVVSTNVWATIETANDHWMMLDVYGTGDLGGTAYYNWNDEPYWIHYGWEVQYADGTWESEGFDVYY
jgi:hypothetical protein